MGLVAKLRKFFACETCEAYRSTIQMLKDERDFYQSQIVSLESALLKATRLAPIVDSSQNQRQMSNPIQTQPSSWREVQRELENKHKVKKSPEDLVAEAWTAKAKGLEEQAGI